MGLGRTVFRLLFLGTFSALLVAVGIRLLDEVAGRRRRQVHVTAKNLERAEEVADAYEAELIELERTVLPGISIRS
jgi:cob(I)alamin adenosyltransferase